MIDVFCGQRVRFEGRCFSLPRTEMYSDENILKAQVIDNVMFCYCPVHSCAYLRHVSKTEQQGGNRCMWECFRCTHMFSDVLVMMVNSQLQIFSQDVISLCMGLETADQTDAKVKGHCNPFHAR